MVLFNTSVTLTQMQALNDASFIGLTGCTLPKIFLDRIGNKMAVSQPGVARKNTREKKSSGSFGYFGIRLCSHKHANYAIYLCTVVCYDSRGLQFDLCRARRIKVRKSYLACSMKQPNKRVCKQKGSANSTHKYQKPWRITIPFQSASQFYWFLLKCQITMSYLQKILLSTRI